MSADPTLSFRPSAPSGGDRRCYLLVVEEARASMFHLPGNGTVLVGRGEEADLRLTDQTASRRHAKIMVHDGRVRIADLDSHNGTRVNGEPVDGARALATGDVITICGATLVLHDGGRGVTTRQPLELAALRDRLEEELDRAQRYGRLLALVALTVEGRLDPGPIAEAISRELRLIDGVAFAGPSSLVLLLPELDAAAVRGAAQRLLDAITPLASGARAGVACLGDDGADADTLIQAARGAAQIAAPGRVAGAADTATTMAIGERRIMVADPAMERIYALLKRLAPSELPVMVLGETGVGKESAAFAVHAWSPRAAKPFVTLNCAALPETLIESELFGYEKGAFSGATGTKQGLFESANGGTVFLDEVGELTPATQVKLLRVLEARRFTRLGSLRERELDLRLVAATNRDLDAEVKAGRFRQDLFFRLAAATVVLPPLRERPRELPILARRFLEEACERAGRTPPPFSPATLKRLAAYPWPGNVRELRHTMDYLAATVAGATVETWDLPDRLTVADPAAEAPERSVRRLADEASELERRRIGEALEATRWVQKRAAERIGMPLRTFVERCKLYGFRRDQE